ncbi:MAG: cytochrome c maturation protein CcmE [Planctomycetota bacterium]|nr:cytochrome c maturation protein CcmE [Planctomycetota bacterium]
MPRVMIAGGVFFIGVAILIGMAVREEGTPTVVIGHITSGEYQGDAVFLVVQVQSVDRLGNPARFTVRDKRAGTRVLQVETREVLSDTFANGSDLRIKGTFDPLKDLFTATWVDTKCPSKYA